MEKENLGSEMYTEKGVKSEPVKESGNIVNGNCVNGSIVPHQNNSLECDGSNSEKFWKQEEQRSLELALQKYPKDTPSRWDKIASFVSTKTKVCFTAFNFCSIVYKFSSCVR